MILDNVKELLIAQEIISEVDLAFYDQERVNLSKSLKNMLEKNKTVLDKIKKYELLIFIIFIFLLEFVLAFQCAVCVKVVGINEIIVFGGCFLEMIILFIIGKQRIDKERQLKLYILNRALEKQEVLKNLDCKNQDRKEYIDYLTKMIDHIILNYKVF